MVQSGLLRVSTRNTGSEYRLMIRQNDIKMNKQELQEPSIFYKRKNQVQHRKNSSRSRKKVSKDI